MAPILEYLIRDSDNIVKLTLKEDDSAITGAWTALDIWVGAVQLTRASDENGIALSTSTGALTIAHGDLTTAEKTALSALITGRRYRVKIRVKSSVNDDGAWFGAAGSDPIFFILSDEP